MGEDYVTITRAKYRRFLELERFVDTLLAAGVDVDLEGYGQAQDLMEDD